MFRQLKMMSIDLRDETEAKQRVEQDVSVDEATEVKIQFDEFEEKMNFSFDH